MARVRSVARTQLENYAIRIEPLPDEARSCYRVRMGRIIVAASMENGVDSSFRIESDALVDTGAAYLTLPVAWRDRLGPLAHLDTVSVETATQAVVSGDICGPVLLRMGEFRPVITEALFIEMEPAEGRYEPLIGYIPLEQAQAVVDMAGRRLAKFGRVDLKAVMPANPLPAGTGKPQRLQRGCGTWEQRYATRPSLPVI